MISLSTDRLILRMFRDDDIDEYAAICDDAEVMRFIGDGKRLSRPESWRNMAMILGHWQLRGYGIWAVEERQSGRLVGRVGFFNPDGWPGFELGWLLGRDHWGRGFATEAGRAALDFAFNVLRRDRVISLIHPGNQPSIRVAQRLGERFDGLVELGGSQVRVYAISQPS